ncbi:very long chain fatty acid elongase AAEL008004 isoform X1 [Leptinotarsa decemlineata]|uniref:very long chain fatty acid elongase AAEL008004 isoform X1 n=1 Tax=Leptinotarsa decemlineata TaxID=7539 RepID=UPI003D30CF8B
MSLYLDVFFLNKFLSQYVDNRLAGWPLMSNPLLIMAITILYIYTAKKLGPALMENRKPFNLKKTLFVYNLMQVIFSSWLFYRLATAGWLTGKFSFICQPLDTSTSPEAMKMVSTVYWYFISKFTEFFDTIFFIMRKKYNQISTLHLIHHGIMPIGSWLAISLSPGGHVSFVPLLNTFVHIIMYSYYLLSAMGPSLKKYLWWKRYLTSLQIIQFVLIMVQSMQPLFTDCPYPRAISCWITCESVLFVFLFKQFYEETYKKVLGKNSKNTSERTTKAN